MTACWSRRLDEDARHEYCRLLLCCPTTDPQRTRSVTRPVLLSLVVSLVLTRLDYGCATLAGLPASLLDRLQSVLNAAARLVNSARKFDHVTPVLRDLHWFRVPERISFRLSALVYRGLHGLAPAYIARDLQPVAAINARRRLRSASTAALLVPMTQHLHHRRPSISCRRCARMEQFAALRHRCAVPAGLPAKTQDRTVPPILCTINIVFILWLIF